MALLSAVLVAERAFPVVVRVAPAVMLKWLATDSRWEAKAERLVKLIVAEEAEEVRLKYWASQTNNSPTADGYGSSVAAEMEEVRSAKAPKIRPLPAALPESLRNDEPGCPLIHRHAEAQPCNAPDLAHKAAQGR